MANFNIQGSVVSQGTGGAVPFATVRVYQFGVPEPLASNLTDVSGKFTLAFSWPHDVSIPGNRPDVHFKVTQRVDGTERILYNENPATQTRKNIGDVLAVTLKIEGGVSTIPPASTGQPVNTLFVFTRVGNIGVNQIRHLRPDPERLRPPRHQPCRAQQRRRERALRLHARSGRVVRPARGCVSLQDPVLDRRGDVERHLGSALEHVLRVRARRRHLADRRHGPVHPGRAGQCLHDAVRRAALRALDLPGPARPLGLRPRCPMACTRCGSWGSRWTPPARCWCPPRR